MKKIHKKILIIFITIILLSTIQTTSYASFFSDFKEDYNIEKVLTYKKLDEELKLYSKSCVLLEYSNSKTGKIAYERNANTVLYPASTTKLLTAILTVENCNLTDTVTITNEMISQIPTGYTTAHLSSGEIVTVEQLLNCLLIPSANDAGYALAIHISGSIENFSNLMNEKAKEIGCKNSNFTNPSGVHNQNHYSTAKDMALIGFYSLNYPQITSICSQTTYELHTNKSNRTLETTNTLLKQNSNSYYSNATGLKTGYTGPAGSCIISTAKKDNMEFLVAVFGAPTPTEQITYRDEDCKTLFEYGFNNYEKIIKNKEHTITLKEVPIQNENNNLDIIFITLLIILFLLILLAFQKKKK